MVNRWISPEAVLLMARSLGAEARLCYEHPDSTVHVLWSDGEVWTFTIADSGALSLETGNIDAPRGAAIYLN